jgi:nucleoside 2-deoxyribosyltransferase
MKKTEYFGQEITIDFNIDYPITFSTNPDEFSNIFDAVKDMGLIESRMIAGGVQYPTITVAGWEKYEEIKRSGPLSNKCFVAMSCNDDLKDAYDNGIKKAVEEAGYQPVFIERKQHNEKICDLIIANIRECKFLVADVTGQRQNVYYEAGFAHGLDRQVIWTCKKDDIKNAHFDTRQYNHILWENAEDLRKKLLNRIKATII